VQSKPRSWTAMSLLSGIWSVPTSWCLHWIVSMRLSRPITRATSTPVPALFSPGWSGCSMPTWRWFRMMTVGWYYSPLLMATLSLLIPRSSVTSLWYLFLIYPAVYRMRWCYLPPYMSFESSSMPFHREKSVLPPSGSAHCLPLITYWPR
jgi:hypothetical protein